MAENKRYRFADADPVREMSGRKLTDAFSELGSSGSHVGSLSEAIATPKEKLGMRPPNLDTAMNSRLAFISSQRVHEPSRRQPCLGVRSKLFFTRRPAQWVCHGLSLAV